MVPAANPRSVSAINGAPISDNRAASSGAVSFAPISISRCTSMSPVSIPASIRIVVTPVRVSPFTIAQLIGPAPRYLGSREACRLVQPSFGIGSNFAGIICPYAMITTPSGASFRSSVSVSGARIFSGWCTASFAASAASFTAENETLCPRPRGRSGCVITPTISMSGCARRCLSVGTANEGVPQKTIRIINPLRPPGGRLRHLPPALFPELLDFPFDQVALQHAEVLHNKNPIQVIDLVAKSPRQQIFPANFKRFALGVLRLYRHKLRPQHVSSKPWNRQAAFFFAHFAFGVNDLRIRQHDLGFGILPSGHVHPRKPQALSNLRRCQSHSLRRVHRSEHILGKLLQFRVEFFNRRAQFLQDRIAILDDRIDLVRWGRHLGRLGSRAAGGLRTRQFVGHSCQNSAASPRASLPQIFAEKHPPAQGRPSLLRPRHRPAPRTNPIARTRPSPAPSSPCPSCAAAVATSKSVSSTRAPPRLRRS